MKFFAGLCALALSCSIWSPPPAQAQTSDRPVSAFSYDISKEVTLNGTVASVLRKPATGMIMGSHLLLTTSSGLVDASLGRFGLTGHGAMTVAAGQQVIVTGLMKTIRDRQVFLARIVKVGSEVYTIRNEHGFPLSPRARGRATQNTAGEGL
ncbi:MAG: hypothetical protein LAO30_04745 [Acidobacteriia bacterium]|nr:hypothetical protein [Terriglobia bacterium]